MLHPWPDDLYELSHSLAAMTLLQHRGDLKVYRAQAGAEAPLGGPISYEEIGEETLDDPGPALLSRT